MRRDGVSTHVELMHALLVIFSAVSLGTIEFIRHAIPAKHVLQVPTTATVYTVLLVQVAPTAVLFVGDRIIAFFDRSGRALRIYRTVLFVGAVTLFLRQFQLYSGPGDGLTSSIAALGPVVSAAVALVALGIVIWLCVSWYSGLTVFFYYMSPVAIAMTAILPYQAALPGQPLEAYATEVARPADSQASPPVFIIILDELSYDALVKDGEIDAASFPSFAALAGEGTWFTNAAANFFRTWFAVPSIIDAVRPLSDQFEVRLYSQFGLVEDGYRAECGKVFTCRGVHYVAEKHPGLLAANLALRSLYQATPRMLEQALARPLGLLVDSLGSTYPSADPDGFQIYTKEQFDVFLGDIDSHQSPGRIYLLHSMVTHFPFAFNEHGKASRAPLTTVGAEKDVDFAALYEKYRKQAMFADSQLGAFMEKLRQEEIYDRAVIIVTADHGLRARPVLPLPEPIELDHLTTQIPLLIRAPGMDSRLSDVDYQHIDFGPTLWDVLGRPPLEGAQGVSAFSAERPVRDKVFWVDDWAYFYSSEDLAWHLGGLAAGMPEEGATGAEPEAETAGTEPAAESTYQ
ncbi:MAG TPA: sulfatase-like hydrolase/transferase [Dehalococcoidia bacterium]|nr:sulfatase-like hydrolase/transferase [Dehalococcoidia bacterium]